MTNSVMRYSFFVSEDDRGSPCVDYQEDPEYGQWVKYDDIKHLLQAEPAERQITTVGGLEQFIGSKYNKSGIDTSGDLLACPFCGHEAGYRAGPRQTDDSGYHISVWCNNTSCGVHTPEHYKDRASAAIAWNRRYTRPEYPY